MELVVWHQFQNPCIEHDLVHRNHHGSIPAHDCVTAVGQLQDAASLAAEENRMAAVIMLDQTAAFDLAVHQLLLVEMGPSTSAAALGSGSGAT